MIIINRKNLYISGSNCIHAERSECLIKMPKQTMRTLRRRDFIKNSAGSAAGIIVAPAYIPNLITNSPNERVNIGLAGISGIRLPEMFKHGLRGMIPGRGIAHMNAYAKIPNVMITKVCDVDERLFPSTISTVEKLFGAKPSTETDFRKMCDDKDIDLISIATPDHWHALHTIWACQAGKDVYVEKPVSFSIWEGRKMVEAARKYNRIVQAGICYRSSESVKEAVKFIAEGKLGKVYMAKGFVYSYRPTIEHTPDESIPEGVNRPLIGPSQRTGTFITGTGCGIPELRNWEITVFTVWIPAAGHWARKRIPLR